MNVAHAQEANVEELTAKSDPAFQAQIQTIFNALHQSGVDPRDNLDAFREVQTFKKLTDDKDKLVEQLAIYAATTESEEDSHVLITLMILQSLELAPSVPIRVLAPYLDADDRQLREFAGIWFHSHDKAGSAPPRSPALKPVNYDDYKRYVSLKIGRGEEIPAGFIRYIFERSPGRALLVFAYANSHGDVTARLQAIRMSIEGRQPDTKEQQEQYDIGRKLATKESREARLRERREIELSEHIVSNAIWLQQNDFAERFQAALPEANAELAKLAKHKQWWVRLYVAEIMRQHPQIRQPELVRQLSADSNELVSKAAMAAD